MKIKLLLVFVVLVAAASAQIPCSNRVPVTPHYGMNVPANNTPYYNSPINENFSCIDNYLVGFITVSACATGVVTPHYGLNIPLAGTLNWGVLINANFVCLDTWLLGHITGNRCSLHGPTTTNFGFNIPATGTLNWQNQIDANFACLDKYLQTLQTGVTGVSFFGFQCGPGATNCPNVGSSPPTPTWPSSVAQPGLLRLWDSQVGWSWLMTAYSGGVGTYSWGQLDGYLDDLAAHPGVLANYVFGCVPTFAGGGPAGPAGSCSTSGGPTPPSDLTTSGSPTFTQFVTDLMAHCSAAGHCVKTLITGYELWNEANVSTGPAQRWTGTQTQLYQMLAPAVAIIKLNIPNARIFTPSITSGTPAATWMTGWLQAELAGGVISNTYNIHQYLNDNPPENVSNQTTIDLGPNFGTVGWTPIPWVMGETGYDDVRFPYSCNTGIYTTADCVGQMVRWNILLFAKGGSGLYWYFWNTYIGSQSQFATAYFYTMQYLIGGTFAGPCTFTTASGIKTYTCGFTESNGTKALFVWTPTEAGTSFTVPAGYTNYRDFAGGNTVLNPNQSITIGVQPFMLEQSPCGPPTYLCSSHSVLPATLPGVPNMGGTNGTNTIGYEYAAPTDFYYPSSGVGNCISRLTDASTRSGDSFGSTVTGGGNDLMWDVNRAYGAVVSFNGWVLYESVSYTAAGCMQVNGHTASVVGLGTNSGFTASRVTGARFYHIDFSAGTKTGLYQQDLTGTSTINVTSTKIFDFNNCPGLPGNLTPSGGYGGLWVSSNDNIYSTNMSFDGGQDTGLWEVVWNRSTNQCASYYTGQVLTTENPANGNIWAFCGPGNCSQTGTNPAPLALNTVCAQPGFGIHANYLTHDGLYAITTGKCNGTVNSQEIWQIGVNNIVTCNNSLLNCGGHLSTGYTTLYEGDTTINIRPASAPSSWTDIISGVGGDFHGALQWVGSASDTNPWMLATTMDVVGTCASQAYCYELLGLRHDGVVARFVNDYFIFTTGSLGPIPTMTQDGYCMIVSSNWNNTLGLDNGGNPRYDVFAICNLQ